MKRFSFMLLFVTLFLLLPVSGQAMAAVKTSTILLDGQVIPMQQKDKVEIINGSVMVPLRIIAENLGMGVIWNQQSSTITIPKAFGSVELTIGQKTAMVDGASQKLTTAPLNRSGTTLVPLRFISEAMGVGVTWDNSSKVVGLTSSPLPQPSAGPGAIPSVTASPGPSATATPEGTATPAATPTPAAGTSTVNEISFSDNRLMIALEGNVQPLIHTVNEPPQIVVELPHTDFAAYFTQAMLWDNNTKSGELDITGYPNISKVYYEVSGIDASTVLVTIELTAGTNYTSNVEIDASSTLFVVDLNTSAPEPTTTPPVNPDNGKKTIVIDAGHGDHDPGGVGATMKLEKVFNLSLALKVEQLLLKEPAFNVVMTRRDDSYPSNSRRADIANELGADAFLSIHANIADGKPNVRGTETYYYRKDSKELADVMHKHLLGATEFKDRKVKNNNYLVLTRSTMPATLLEVGFLSNATEEAILFSDEFQNRVAAAIVAGIKEYFGVP
ncbi:hypothetical protein GCM10010912_40630 [Paenibacillus albidus]|uniref:MurNAc-LAA domain-containing protein n=1 Tax=Paenibacillus albidus TaxID=2041023 RepID=A0A917CKA3_9BACL|nr:N-acetylmuramoyl-L-alanine amidase [Paenibacillus albidus]GGF91497.1 hypothetical protein GCM10010912_40630 [Paenibacillus albidus]